MFLLFKIYLINFISLSGIPPIIEFAGKLIVNTEFSSTIEF
jgi:NADH:ubiquinone oxidoreductase subunit 2 (subunit N)